MLVSYLVTREELRFAIGVKRETLANSISLRFDIHSHAEGTEIMSMRSSAIKVFVLLNIVVATLPAQQASSADLRFQCRWISGDSGREKDVDVVTVDIDKQKLDFLITKENDGWTYSNTKNEKLYDGHDALDLRRSPQGLISATAFRADIPAIVTLDENAGRLTWIYAFGLTIKRFEYNCIQRGTR